jgi:putative transposase
MRQIDKPRLVDTTMGARRPRRMSLIEGICVGRRHLGTLCRAWIEALCAQPGVGLRNPLHKVYPYLLRKITITMGICRPREVIAQVFACLGVPEFVNTDQGSQLTSEKSTVALLSRSCHLAMDWKNEWRENVFVERQWCTTRYVRVYLPAYNGVSAARTFIVQFLNRYNIELAHISLDYQTPDRTTRLCCRFWMMGPKQTSGANSRLPSWGKTEIGHDQ